MRDSSSGVSKKVWNALTGWFRRLRGGNLPPKESKSGPAIQADALAALPARSARVDGRSARGKRRPDATTRAARREKGSSMDGAELTLDQLCRYLEEDGFGYTVREDQTTVETGFRSRTGAFRLVIFLREEPALLGVLVRIPEVVPEAKRPEVADALTRANYGLSLGCFEMDMSDGELDFRVAVPTYGSSLNQAQFRALLGAAMWTTDRYHRAFCRLIYSDDLSPAEVIAEVEMAESDRGKKD